MATVNTGSVVSEAASRRWGWLHIPRIAVDSAAILAFVAAILATNYALASVPNVKLFDVMVFVAGYTLGLRRGIAVALLAWLVYGNFNPFGPTTATLLVTVMAAETLYAVAGAMVRKAIPPQRVRILPSRASLVFAIVAVVCTLAYDVATNVYTGFSWAVYSGSSEYARWIWTALFNPGALYFSAGHLSGNILFFGAIGPLLIKGVEKVQGRKSS